MDVKNSVKPTKDGAGSATLLTIIMALMITGLGMVQAGAASGTYLTVVLGIVVIAVGFVMAIIRYNVWGKTPEQ